MIKKVGEANLIVLLSVPGHQQDLQPMESMHDIICAVLQKPEFVNVKSSQLSQKNSECIVHTV